MPDEIAKLPQQPINGQPSGLRKPKKGFLRKIFFWVFGIFIIIVIALAVAAVIWYNSQLSSVGNDMSLLKKIRIDSGSTSGQISKSLQDQSIIKSSVAFDIYLRLTGKNNFLKAGVYRLSPAETTPQIIEHLIKGSVDTFNITFYPGATLVDNSNSDTKYDVRTVLKKAQYSDQEIDDAFSETYSGLIFKGKPSTADLEGYVYGQTYNFNTGATVRDILERVFDEFYSVIEQNKIEEGFASHGLNLYQGITLASIVQRESSSATDQKQVAQVFYSRLKLGMMLGSDVTYQYIADKTGVPRDTNLDSPYNTRRYAGLPPGPIATPGLSALLAVAQPATGDYLYFLSDSNGKMYFAKTDAEHQANIVNYCKDACIEL